MNQMLMQQVSDLESKLKTQEVEANATIAKLQKASQKFEQSSEDLKHQRNELKLRVIELENELGVYEDETDKLKQQLESFKQREIDRLEETDLDDVDLISEATKKKQVVSKPPHPLVPCLDFDKMKMQQEEEMKKLMVLKNELDEDIPFEDMKIAVNSHDEEFEEPSNLATEFEENMFEGSLINSNSEGEILRNHEMMIRKADVINQLNDIYANDQMEDGLLDDSEGDSCGIYYQNEKQYDTDH